MQTLEQFRATHERSTDFAAWSHLAPIHEHAITVAVHVFRDHSDSPFIVVEQGSCMPRRKWFEYDWTHGIPSPLLGTLDEASERLFHEFVQRDVAA